jgi:hypothetical protein
MKYTFLSILTIASIGIPAHAFQIQKEEVRISKIEEKIDSLPYCSDRASIKEWVYQKPRVIVRMKPFVMSTSIDLN